MKIINPNAEELFNNDPYLHIEKIGRICYKSEDKITDKSAEPFIARLFNSSHTAMLEHFIFIVQVPEHHYENIMRNHPKYIIGTNTDRPIISASARALYEFMVQIETDDRDAYIAVTALIKHIICEYAVSALFGGMSPCHQFNMHVLNMDELDYYEELMHGWHSVLFTCDRGVSHEFVRHRDASFAQESTRYCNYGHDEEITVIKPMFYKAGSEKYNLWFNSCCMAESTYMLLLRAGSTPQEARSVLPNSLKTELVITARNLEWQHIINLRHVGITGAPHPQMKQVMNIMVENCPWANRMVLKGENWL